MKPTNHYWISITVLMLATLACASSSAPTSMPVEEKSPTAPPPTLVTVVPTSTAASASATEAIQHESVPGELPDSRRSYAADQDSFITSPEKRAPGGDRFTFGRYERPFNGVTMDLYFPEIDILETFSYHDATWIYFSITLRGLDLNYVLSGKYAVEIDADLDGRGDWLIISSGPISKEWTTDGTEVWYDSNNDVGGSLSVTADDQSQGNGYDTKIFDRGTGDDPDLAWTRIEPGQPLNVQLAIKSFLLGTNGVYMAGSWAGKDTLDPSLFDLNDHFTHEQAGASLKELEFFYPIKAVAEIDNTCRVAVGFQPSGGEPGLCALESGDSCLPSQEVCVDTPYGPNCFCPNK